MSSHYNKTAVRTSLMHFLLGKGLNAIMSLLTLTALARWMMPDAYGVYIVFLALQFSLLALSSLGIDTTAERFLPELRTRHPDSELLGFMMAAMFARLGSLLLLTLIAWFAAQPITNLIGLELYFGIFQFFNAEVMKLLVTRLLGVLQAAHFGFAYSWAETVQRYLPAVFLLRLIKPVFVNRYTKTGDFAQLNEMARIILKLNLLMLAPIIAFTAVYGEEFLFILSKGKYADAHWIFVSVLGLLVLTSHQLVLSLLASTLEKNAMQLYAGIVSTIAFPCALFLIPSMGAVVVSAVSGFIYNTFATIYLRYAGYNYRPDLRGAFVFLISGGLLYGITLVLHRALTGWIWNAVAMSIGTVIYLAILRVMSAFSHKERELINSILPKRVFIF